MFRRSASINEMANSLTSKDLDAIFISSAHKLILEEENTDFSQKLQKKIIYTITVEVNENGSVEAKEVEVSKDVFTVFISGIDTYGDIGIRSRSDVETCLLLLILLHMKYY